MRYEEPSIQILLRDDADVVRTSSGVETGTGLPEVGTDEGLWPTSSQS